MLPLLQKTFLQVIMGIFSPFGAVASTRILWPSRQLPSGMWKSMPCFPKLLSKYCALVEHKSLESACRAFKDCPDRLPAAPVALL